MYKYITLAFMASCSPALAAPVCTENDKMTRALTDKLGQVQVFTGITENGSLIELYASDTTGVWTVILTGPNMNSCVASVGTAFSLTGKPQEEPNL